MLYDYASDVKSSASIFERQKVCQRRSRGRCVCCGRQRDETRPLSSRSRGCCQRSSQDRSDAVPRQVQNSRPYQPAAFRKVHLKYAIVFEKVRNSRPKPTCECSWSSSGSPVAAEPGMTSKVLLSRAFSMFWRIKDRTRQR